LLRAIASYEGQPLTRAALELSALLFQRPGNIRQMEWAELDFDGGLWTIPAAKMKRTVHDKVNGRPHVVPLAARAVAILRDLHPLTGHGRFVFPSLLTGERSMSENTLRTALRRMGYTNDEMTPHGFRAMARTILVEQLNVNPDVIEAQLAHGKSGPLGAAYDRAEFLNQRRAMMATWADYLEHLRQGRSGVPLNATKKRPRTSTERTRRGALNKGTHLRPHCLAVADGTIASRRELPQCEDAGSCCSQVALTGHNRVPAMVSYAACY
jgi:hypothetical protein